MAPTNCLASHGLPQANVADCRIDAERRSEVTMLRRLTALHLIDKYDIFPNPDHKCPLTLLLQVRLSFVP